MATSRTISFHGFALTEVLVVIVILGIMAAWAANRYSDIDAALLPPRTESFISHMRLAQARAMSTNTVWGIHYDASSGADHYCLFHDSAENRVILPGEASEWIELDDMGITIPQGSFTLSFDTWGRPACSGCTTAGRLFSITLAKPGSGTGTITIAWNTGFIQQQ